MMKNILKKLTLPIMAIGMIAGASISAKADVAFDTLVDIGNTALSGGWNIQSSQEVATPFSPNFNIMLTMITPNMWHIAGDLTYTLALYADDGLGSLDSTNLLGSVSQVVPNPNFEDVPFDFSSQNLSLLAGTQYWALLSPNNDASIPGTDDDTVGVIIYISEFGVYERGLSADNLDAYYSNFPIIKVEGTRVNEPLSLLLIGQGLVLISLMAYRRKKA